MNYKINMQIKYKNYKNNNKKNKKIKINYKLCNKN